MELLRRKYTLVSHPFLLWIRTVILILQVIKLLIDNFNVFVLVLSLAAELRKFLF